MKNLMYSMIFIISLFNTEKNVVCDCDFVKEIITNQEFLGLLNLQNEKIIYLNDNYYCKLNVKINQNFEIITLNPNDDFKHKKTLEILKVSETNNEITFFHRIENIEITVIKSEGMYKFKVIEK